MSAAAVEKFLARLYVDEEARARFLRNPRQEAKTAGLTEKKSLALERIDRLGLDLAAGSFAKKRSQIRKKTNVMNIVGRGKKLARYFGLAG